MFDLAVGSIIGGIISILVGIVIIVWPKIIAYVIGAWMIIIGVLAILYALL